MRHYLIKLLSRYTTLTHHLEAGKEALKEVFAGVGHGEGAKLRHHDAVLFTVLLVGIAVQEPAHVRHLAIVYFELVHHGHSIEPVVVAVERDAQV